MVEVHKKYLNSKDKKKKLREQQKEQEEADKAKAPKKREVPRWQKNEPKRDEDEEDGDEKYHRSEDDESSNEEVGAHKADGLADMMAKILNQNTGSKVPLLAKRKTAQMKEIEEDRKSAQQMKVARIERLEKQSKQLVVPDILTADYERQLKKLATRGVVALFNAISEAKRNEAEELAAKEDSKKEFQAGEVIESSSSKKSKKKNAKFLNDDDSFSEVTGGKKKPEGDKNANSKPNWKALKDDYMMNSSLKMKNWDKEISEDEDEGGY